MLGIYSNNADVGLTLFNVVYVTAAHLIADRGACVQDCGAGHVAGPDNKCVDCDGPCPRGSR